MSEPALDETVDDGGDRGLGDREPLGDERRALVAGGDEGEHPVLGEGEVAGGVLERAGREGEAPDGPGPRRVGGGSGRRSAVTP